MAESGLVMADSTASWTGLVVDRAGEGRGLQITISTAAMNPRIARVNRARFIAKVVTSLQKLHELQELHSKGLRDRDVGSW